MPLSFIKFILLRLESPDESLVWGWSCRSWSFMKFELRIWNSKFTKLYTEVKGVSQIPNLSHPLSSVYTMQSLKIFMNVFDKFQHSPNRVQRTVCIFLLHFTTNLISYKINKFPMKSKEKVQNISFLRISKFSFFHQVSKENRKLIRNMKTHIYLMNKQEQHQTRKTQLRE